MIRYGMLALLGMLLAATPATAGEPSFAPRSFVTGSAARASVQAPLTTSPFVVATQPFAASNSVANPLPFQVQRPLDQRHRRHVPVIVGAPALAPQVIVVQQPVYYTEVVASAPSQCVADGYWSYRWIPYTTMQTVWVQGSWGADGSWTDSHYEARPYASGYYEPFWIPAQSYAC
jgi:hypothetical protein